MKLLEFQKRMEAIKKDSSNPFFKSSYLSLNGLLDAIKPLLNELELVLVQPIQVIEGGMAISTQLIDGDKVILSSGMLIPNLTDPQKIGSAITYYRRYAIQSMLLLQAEDDDGNQAAKPEVKKEPLKETVSVKQEIADLLDKIDPTKQPKTKEGYQALCLSLTGLELSEANFTNILKNLKENYGK